MTTRRLFALILFTALFAMTVREISDPDFWWHLRTGQLILNSQSIPHTDLFSFTASGKEWVTHEWLSEVLIYLLYRLGGFTLLSIFFATVITVAFSVAFWNSDARPYAAGFVVFLGALATAPTWGVRPQMLSLLLSSIFLFLLDRYAQRDGLKYIAPLVPLTILWVNLHSGFALGLAIVAAYLFARVAEPFLTHSLALPPSHTLQPLTIVFLLCVLAVLINPNGARMYSYPFETLTSRAMQTYIQEWFSPDFHDPQWQPFAFLLIGLIVAGIASRARVPVPQLLLLALLGYASLRSARNIPLFVLVAIPVLSQQLGEIFSKLGVPTQSTCPPTTPRVVRIINALLFVLVLLVVLARVYVVVNNQANVERAKFPAAAVDYIQSQHPPRNIYNAYGWGGYLVWRLYPDYPVYIDGRADVYGDLFIEDYLKIYRAESGWDEKLARADVNLALLEVDSPLTNAMAASSNWRQVFGDDRSVVFEKK